MPCVRNLEIQGVVVCFMLQHADGHISLSLRASNFFLNINMQMKDGNKPPENEQGVTLVLFNTTTELVACTVCYSKKTTTKKTKYKLQCTTTFYIFLSLPLKVDFSKNIQLSWTALLWMAINFNYIPPLTGRIRKFSFCWLTNQTSITQWW